MALFHNRLEAAHELARHLLFLKNDNPIVLGLANGGVPIAEVIAQALEAPLDILLIDHIAAPQNPDHIVGAVDEHGRISAIRQTARWHELTSQQMIAPARQKFHDLQRRSGRVRAILPEMDVRDRAVIVVSEGVSTGASMLGAIASLRDRNARKVIAAAPAGAGKAAWSLHEAADLVIIPHRPDRFVSVPNLYAEYSAINDELVIAIIERWVQSRPQQLPGIKTFRMKMNNDLGQLIFAEIDTPPGAARGSGPYPTVIMAHNFESDGRSQRTIPIARRLAEIGFFAVRLDLTGHGRSEGELADATPQRMYNDLKITLNTVRGLDEVDADRVGLVGSGSGAMLALNLAAEDPRIRAVVTRSPMSGREIDAAMHVKAATLLIHTDEDTDLLRASTEPGHRLPSSHQLLKIPDSTRLFNDAISLKMMVGATVDWLDDHLMPIPVGDVDDDASTADAPSGAAAQPQRGR
jgi:putative phosphoribosyl transferase